MDSPGPASVGPRGSDHVLCLATAGSAAGEAPVPPYGTNDAGGFRNVLPTGENGLDNAAQLAEFQLKGTYPPYYNDQVIELTRTLPR